MKKILFTLLILLIFISPAKSQEIKIGSQQSVEPLPSKSIVRGRVVYEDSGRPVRRGLIGLLNIKDNFKDAENSNGFLSSDIGISEFVLTNDDGEFEIKGVKAGVYYPFVDMPNVLNLQGVNKFYDKNNVLALAKFEKFFQKITVDGFSEINVLISVKRGAAVSGRISYSDGSPAVNFKIEIIRKKMEEWDEEEITVQKGITDDRGFYRFTELLPGEYFIKVIEPSDHRGNGKVDEWRVFSDGSELNIFYPNASEIDKAKSVEVDWGQEQTNIDLIIPDRKLFKISGVVVAKDTQEPVANIPLKFQKIDEAKGANYYTSRINTIYTDEKGNWSYKDLPQGIYRLETSSSENKSEKYARTYKEVKIENEDVPDILIELSLESSVSGIVKVEGDKNLPKLTQIFLFDTENKISADERLYNRSNNKTNSGQEYSFRIGSLSKGNYVFRVYVSDGFYVKSAKFNNTDLTTGPLEIGEAEEMKDILITLSDDTGTLTGKIFESQNVPAKLAPIILVPTDSLKQKGNNLYFQAISNNNGEFQIKAAPGEYFITFPKTEDRNLSDEERLKKLVKDAEKITIKTGKSKNISLFLP